MKTILGWVIGIAIIIFIVNAIGGLGNYEGENAEHWFNAYDEETGKIDELQQQVDDLQTQVEDLQTALHNANSNIEEANTKIRYAKYYSGESYSEMVDALDSLKEIDIVPEP